MSLESTAKARNTSFTHWLQSAGSRWQNADSSTRVYALSVGVLFAIGIVFRSVRVFYDPIALWADEAVWASRLLEQSPFAPSFRPLGFMLISRLLAEISGADERALRLPSYLASLASLWLFFDLSRLWLQQRAVRVLLLGVAAFQPMLIDFAREFKPYSFELAVHLFLLTRCVRFLSSRTRRDLWMLLLAAPVAFLFAYNCIFLFPALFGVLGLSLLRSRAWARLRWVVVSAGGCVLLICVLTAVVFTRIPKGEDDSGFWGKKYGVFYVPNTEQSHVAWAAMKSVEVTQLAGVGRLFWEPPPWFVGKPLEAFSAMERWSFTLLTGAGCALLIRRRRFEVLTLLLAPLLTMLLFNCLDRWPWGAFRVNVFAMAYALPLPFWGLEACLNPLGNKKWAPLLVAAALQWWPPLAFGFGWHDTKRAWTGHSEFPKLVEQLRREREERLLSDPKAPRELILLDAYTCGVQEFYFKHHRRVLARHGEYFSRNFTWRCIRDIGETARTVQARRGQRTWIMVNKWPLVPYVKQAIERVVRIDHVEIQKHSHLLLRIDG